MTHALKESLAKLLCLSPNRLFKTSKRIRAEYAGAEWKLCLCLLAAARSGAYRKLGFATISEYAEKALSISGRKTKELLCTASTLEHLPLLSEAFQQGRIGWGKVRAIRCLVTPETEKEWLEFALAHPTDVVVKKVTLSPTSWKRNQALQASLDGKPVVSKEAVQELLQTSDPPSQNENIASQSSVSIALETTQMSVSTESSESLSLTSAERHIHPPCLPKTILVSFQLTPDEYALYERAQARIRAQAQGRISRSKVLAKMSEQVLEAGSARSRAKHQVVIFIDQASGKAWYETEKGPLPVDPSVLEEALKRCDPIVVVKDRSDTSQLSTVDQDDDVSRQEDIGETQATLETTQETLETPEENLERSQENSEVEIDLRTPEAKLDIEKMKSSDRGANKKTQMTRTAIPNRILRILFAQAGHRCQRCNSASSLLEVHHKKPVSEGGDNRIESLMVLCRACHSLIHESDYATKPGWQATKEARRKRRSVRTKEAVP